MFRLTEVGVVDLSAWVGGDAVLPECNTALGEMNGSLTTGEPVAFVMRDGKPVTTVKCDMLRQCNMMIHHDLRQLSDVKRLKSWTASLPWQNVRKMKQVDLTNRKGRLRRELANET